MSGPILLLLNDAEMLDEHGMTWDLTCEEVLGGVGRATLNIQDRTNTLEVESHWDVAAIIRSSGWVLWRGEVITPGVELKPSEPWRTWKLDCSDYNGEFEQRKIGAFDGKIWIDESGLGIYTNIDPFAHSLSTDRLTVQQWFDHYIRVHGEAFDTDEFVGEFLTDFYPVSVEYGDLQGALEQLAAMIVQNLQFWADPDLKFHWVTIPPWQDLAQDAVAVILDESASGMPGMGPESAVGDLVIAPYAVVDVDSDGSDTIGFSDLEFSYDGANMPEQIYVRGGTGYVYNAPPIPPVEETKTVVKVPTSGAGTYQVTFTTTTKLWHTDSTGYVSISYDTVGASGPYPVKWVTVAWNESRNKGGNYWKLLSGPNSGKLVDDNTNYLNGYGHIVVEKVTSGPGDPADPVVGIGGSGWVNESDQDLNLRQAYLEMPVSTTQALRDSFGGQALYRGSFPTLRGSVKVRGFDGWRAGQLMKITDARLPSALNAKYFIIQRVSSTLLEGTDIREYSLDWGDGPVGRYSGEPAPTDVGWPPPVTQIDVQAHDLTPGPNSPQTITGQLVNGAGEPWNIGGKVVNWSLECYNNLGVLQTGQGTVNPTVSITNKNGRATTTFTSGPGVNLVYFIFADVIAI